MNVRNCRKCNKLFNYVTGVPICPACKDALEKKFQEVKAYILEHNTVPLQTVADECDVEISQLNQWVREERLIFSEDSVMSISCERCGVAIRTGRFCDKCKTETMNDLISAGRRPEVEAPARKKDTTEAAKMRFLDKK